MAVRRANDSSVMPVLVTGIHESPEQARRSRPGNEVEFIRLPASRQRSAPKSEYPDPLEIDMKHIACFVAALFVATTSLPAAAQQQGCTKRPDIVGHLARNYSEAPVAIGLSSNGGIIEVLSSEKCASWTIIITQPDGNTCLLAAGESWERITTIAKLGSGV
jgi:hypothetical protein